MEQEIIKCVDETFSQPEKNNHLFSLGANFCCRPVTTGPDKTRPLTYINRPTMLAKAEEHIQLFFAPTQKG